jgi:hypothetical protein
MGRGITASGFCIPFDELTDLDESGGLEPVVYSEGL